VFATAVKKIDVFRHLRFLIKSAEDCLKREPSLVDLQNQATATSTVVRAMQSELAATRRQQDLDHAQVEEEKDGRKNET
jgi:hypothetical protein